MNELEAFRSKRGLKQKELAQRFGMPETSGQVTISRIEQGKRSMPGIMRALIDEIEVNEELRREIANLEAALRAMMGKAG